MLFPKDFIDLSTELNLLKAASKVSSCTNKKVVTTDLSNNSTCLVTARECERGNESVREPRTFLHHSVLVQILEPATERGVVVLAVLLNQIVPSLVFVDAGRNVGDHLQCHKQRVPVNVTFLGALDQLIQQQWVLKNSLNWLDHNGRYVEAVCLVLNARLTATHEIARFRVG